MLKVLSILIFVYFFKYETIVLYVLQFFLLIFFCLGSVMRLRLGQPILAQANQSSPSLLQLLISNYVRYDFSAYNTEI